MAITRRSFATRALALASIPAVDAAPRKRIHRMGPATPAVYSPAVQWGSLLFLSGKGSGTAPDPADIRSCTNHVLDALAKEIANAGSSMEKVLKITVYL